MSRFRLVQDRFYPQARALRAVFEERFREPRQTHSDRFAWDYWHVPGQYTVIRTPAWLYFPERLYQAFHKALVGWGRRTLGCWDVSPTWLSYYVEGCRQELHADVPHGPWAFVYGLCPPGQPRYQGGETLILRPEVLDYWRHFAGEQDREASAFVEKIPARFDRLVVFDPRLPHGVTEVRGTHDPRQARLVLHGWFTEPRPFLEGPHPRRAVDRVLEQALPELAAGLPGPLHGMLSLRLSLAPDGRVAAARTLANTVVALEAPGQLEAAAVRQVLRGLKTLRFPRARGTSQLTVPLLFR